MKTPTGRTRARSKKEVSHATGLITALKFVSQAQRKTGNVQQTHCIFKGDMLFAYDGSLAIGVPVKADFDACPHTETLISALSKCGSEFTISVSETNFVVSAPEFSIEIPTASQTEMAMVTPDHNIAQVNNAVKFAIVGAAELASETAKFAVAASINLGPGTAIGTNRKLILEIWHGVDLPPNMIIPKRAAATIAKNDAEMIGFGYSGATATFHYADGSFIKTELLNENWPDVSPFLDLPLRNLWPIPDEFFSALRVVAPFSDDGLVHFSETEIRCGSAVYKIEGLPNGKSYDVKNLLLCEKYAKQFDFETTNGQANFVGDIARGALIQGGE